MKPKFFSALPEVYQKILKNAKKMKVIRFPNLRVSTILFSWKTWNLQKTTTILLYFVLDSYLLVDKEEVTTIIISTCF